MFSLSLTTHEEVKKFLGGINPNKAVGFDSIPPNSVKLAAETLATPLSRAINNSILKGVFPSQAKIAVVSPLDKGGLDKNSILN